MRRLGTLLALTVVASVVMTVSPAHACSCAAPLDDGTPESVRIAERLERADGAFVGLWIGADDLSLPQIAANQAESLRTGEPVAMPYPGPKRHHFAVIHAVKGDIGDAIAVVTEGSSSSCGFDVSHERVMAMFVSRIDDSTWSSHLCALTSAEALLGTAHLPEGVRVELSDPVARPRTAPRSIALPNDEEGDGPGATLLGLAVGVVVLGGLTTGLRLSRRSTGAG